MIREVEIGYRRTKIVVIQYLYYKLLDDRLCIIVEGFVTLLDTWHVQVVLSTGVKSRWEALHTYNQLGYSSSNIQTQFIYFMLVKNNNNFPSFSSIHRI